MTYKVRMGSGRIEVSTLAEASREFRAWIERLGFGSSDLQRNDGLVYEDKDRAAKFRVAYNGTIWTSNGKPVNPMCDGTVEEAVVDTDNLHCAACGDLYAPVGANHTHDGKCPRCLSDSTGVES